MSKPGKTYEKMRRDILQDEWNPIYLKYHFEEVRRMLPPVVEEDFAGSRGFLEWLRGYDFNG